MEIKEFIRKKQMIEYIMDYYSQLGEALNEVEYEELISIHGASGKTNKLGKFKDFTIYRLFNGDWRIERAI